MQLRYTHTCKNSFTPFSSPHYSLLLSLPPVVNRREMMCAIPIQEFEWFRNIQCDDYNFRQAVGYVSRSVAGTLFAAKSFNVSFRIHSKYKLLLSSVSSLALTTISTVVCCKTSLPCLCCQMCSRVAAHFVLIHKRPSRTSYLINLVWQGFWQPLSI
jgi:hypothetical protein